MSVIGCHLHHMLLIWRSFRNSNKTFVPNLFYAGPFVNRSTSYKLCWLNCFQEFGTGPASPDGAYFNTGWV